MGKHIKKRFEFSKIVAVLAIIMWVSVNVFGCAMIVITLDTSPLVYINARIDEVVAVVLGCYYHKAKMENVIKLKKEYGDDADFVIKNQHVYAPKDEEESILKF